MHVVLSCDPGKTGAVATFNDGKFVSVHDPKDGELAPVFADLLVESLDFRFAVTVVIERVNGVPGQSGPAAFNFGDGFGQLKGVCLGLGVTPVLVPPSVWKQAIGLRGADKKASVAMAASRWGADLFHLAKHDGRAEAALLGAYWIDEQRRLAA